jgi:tRNA(fMet)-specific endonuclease VapC
MSASGSLLLDTNFVVALIAGEAAVVARVGSAERAFLPSIVVGELYYGAFRSSRVQANVARVDRLVISRAVLAATAVTARQYGALKNLLRQAGRPIPENDLWIAARAIEHGLTLLTRDQHFAGIAGLTTENV